MNANYTQTSDLHEDEGTYMVLALIGQHVAAKKWADDEAGARVHFDALVERYTTRNLTSKAVDIVLIKGGNAGGDVLAETRIR